MRTSQIIPVKALAKAALLFDFSITRCQGWRLSRRPLTIRVRGDGHGKPTQARNGRQCAGAEVDCTSRARARGVAAPAVDDSAGRGSRPISADPRRSGATSALAADVGGFCARGPAAAPPSFFAEWWLAFLEPPSLGSRICLPARTVVEQGPALSRLSDNRSSSAPAICPCVLNATPNTLRRRRTRRRDRGCGRGWPALGERAAIRCGHGNSGASILVRRPLSVDPCPSTGNTTGACPGYRKDYIMPLACGGVDAVSNSGSQVRILLHPPIVQNSENVIMSDGLSGERIVGNASPFNPCAPRPDRSG